MMMMIMSVFGEGADIIIVIVHITLFLIPLFIPSYHVTLLSLSLSLSHLYFVCYPAICRQGCSTKHGSCKVPGDCKIGRASCRERV